jgi:predicted phage terminase large subunit-like protein
LLDGNWKVKAEAGKVFDRSWFEIVDYVPDGGDECRFWDTAGTAKQMAGSSGQARRQRDPDYTAGVKIRRVNGVYYVLDCIAKQIGPAEIDDLIKKTAERDAAEAAGRRATHKVAWETPPGSAGIREDEHLTALLGGYRRGGYRPTGDKYVRSKPLAVEAESRNVKLLRGTWNEEWLTHMHHQPDIAHDDIHDASAGAFNALAAEGGVWVRDYAGNFRE